MSISQTYNLIAYPRNIYFSNSDVGFTLGGDSNLRGNIQKTTDGGTTWITTYNTQQYLLGFTLRGNNYFGVGNFGTIVKSIDKGLNWTTLKPPTNLSLTDIDFPSDSTGYTVGGGYFEPVFLKTTDEGNSWFNLPVNINLGLSGASFINDNFGFLVGNGIIWKTTDGGKTLSDQLSNSNFSSVFMIDTLTAFTAGWYGTNTAILKTTDSGISWNINFINSSTAGEIVKVKFYNHDLGIAITEGCAVLRTSNSGATWSENILADYQDYVLFDIFFLDEKNAWIIGKEYYYNKGIIYKTMDGGLSWHLLTKLIPIPTNFRFYQNNPNPFNSSATIKYELPEDSRVTIKVYDILGKEVITLVDEYKRKGIYDTIFEGSNLASGVYFYSINVTDFYSINKKYSETKKMILTK